MWSPELQTAIFNELLVSVRRKSLVFLQTNPAVVTLLELPAVGEHFVAVDISSEKISDVSLDGRLLLLRNLEHAAHQQDNVSRLGRIREEVNVLLDNEARVCLVSSVPRMSYPPCPGSSLLLDALFFYPDRAIVKAAPSVAGAESATCWPPDVDIQSLKDCLRVLGLDVLSALDFLLFDLQVVSEVSATQLPSPEWDALRGAGLVAPKRDDTDVMELSVPVVKLRESLSIVISESLGVQPAYRTVVESLVRIERTIRLALRRRSIDSFGAKWRGQAIPGGMAEAALKRARSDSAADVTIKALRDPFEWLTMGELIALVTGNQYPDHLGLSTEFWSNFRHEVLPIRNRVSHMRLLRADDRRVVQYWLNRLERKLLQ